MTRNRGGNTLRRGQESTACHHGRGARPASRLLSSAHSSTCPTLRDDARRGVDFDGFGMEFLCHPEQASSNVFFRSHLSEL